ncbi:MAG: hypothetical protein RQ966_18315 [Acetobacteraceae bacterium]|nr:hypothetical protein [Acetobacteraceae bacterium]
MRSRVADQDVTAERQIGPAAPSRAVNHTNDGGPALGNALEELLQQTIPSQGIVVWAQRTNVETGTPDLRGWCSPQNHDADRGRQLVERFDECG